MLDLGRKPPLIVLGFLAMTWLAHFVSAHLGLGLLDPWGNAPRAERVLGYLNRPATEDVLVLGSSRVAGGLDAPLLGELLSATLGRDVTVYKLGVAGLRNVSLYDLLRFGVARRPPRRLLVLAIEARFWVRAESDVARAEQDDDVIHGEWEGEALSGRVAGWFGGLRSLWTLSWAWRPAVRAAAHELGAHLGEHLTAEEREEVERQKVADRRNVPDLFALPPGVSWQWPSDTDDEVLAFERLLDLVDTLPCEVVFVRMPLMPGFDERFMPLASRRFHQEVVPRIEARGHRFHDLQGPPYPDQAGLFYSATHLNNAGRRAASQALAQHLLGPLLSGSSR